MKTQISFQLWGGGDEIDRISQDQTLLGVLMCGYDLKLHLFEFTLSYAANPDQLEICKGTELAGF